MSLQSRTRGTGMKERRGSGARSLPRRRPSSDGLWPFLFVGPLLVGVFTFYIYPIVDTFFISFTKQSAFGTNTTFVGLENYHKLFAKPELWLSLTNTLFYTGVLLLGIPISVVLAALLSIPNLRGAAFYRVAFFAPYLAMPTAVALVWRMIYQGDFGILNYFLRTVGVEDPPYWLATPGYTVFAAAVVGLWSSIGFNVIILSAGLKNISPELYEAAAIDGASPIKQFFSITIPLLTPSIFFLGVIQTINGFQMFDLLFAMMGGKANPALPSSRTLVYYFFNEGFELNHKGLAAAVAIVILLLVALVTLIQFQFQKRWVNYV